MLFFKGKIHPSMLSKDMMHLTVCLNEIPNFQNYGHGYFVFVLIELRTVVQIKVVNIVGCSKTYICSFPV